MFPENVYFTFSFFVCILPATLNFNDFFLMNIYFLEIFGLFIFSPKSSHQLKSKSTPFQSEQVADQNYFSC